MINPNHARFAAALTKAYEAANAAQAGKIEDMRSLNCGFAWVVVHDRSFMAWCRKMLKTDTTSIYVVGDAQIRRDMYYGDKHHAAGWCFWKPGSFAGQDVDIHFAGAKAFSDTLAHELQIRCDYSSRLD